MVAGDTEFANIVFVFADSEDRYTELRYPPEKGPPTITRKLLFKCLQKQGIVSVCDITSYVTLGVGSDADCMELGDLNLQFMDVNLATFKDNHVYLTRLQGALPQMTGWMNLMILGLENKAAEKGLVEMRKHHPDAERICRKQFISADKKDQFEVDGLIVSKQCTMFLEVKTIIRLSTIAQVDKRVDKIRRLTAKEGNTTEVSRLFYEKKLKIVVVGQAVDPRARKLLAQKIADEGWEVWLPDGSGLALGDACFKIDKTGERCLVNPAGHCGTSALPVGGSGGQSNALRRLSTSPFGTSPPSSRMACPRPGLCPQRASLCRGVAVVLRPHAMLASGLALGRGLGGRDSRCSITGRRGALCL